MMTPRERVLVALDHREPDRVPLDLGATNVTGIHRVVLEKVLAGLGMDIELTTLDPRIGLAVVDRDVRDRFDVDAAMIAQAGPSPERYRLAVETIDDHADLRDEFGVVWRMPLDQGLYFDMVEHPLSGDISVADVERYAWPDPLDPHRFEGMAERARIVVEEERRATCFGNMATGMFELGQRMRGFQAFFMDVLMDVSLAEALLDRALELKLAYWGRVLELAGEYVDVVVETDDYGTQQSLLISPDTWRALVKPRLRMLTDFVHSHSRARVFLHSCGAIRELIPDLIDAGVDILNPIQVSAEGMDTAALKAEFGRDIVFWGGGVDTQRQLPGGSAQAVRNEVRRRIDDLRRDGGFVFAAVHNIQPDVPAANVLAMLEAAQEHRPYPEA